METNNYIMHVFIYLLFFICYRTSTTHGFQRLFTEKNCTSKPIQLLLFHLLGILLLGIFPIFISLQQFSDLLLIYSIPNTVVVYLFFITLVLVVSIAFLQISKVKNKPQQSFNETIHPIILSAPFAMGYFTIRTIFLFAYELWFRGFFLFDCIRWFGIPTALFINVLLYILLHVFNSKKEIVACIPFGLLLCSLNVLFQSVWPAIVLHISLSLVYEITGYHNLIKNLRHAKSR